ncbi:MAG: cell wall hydrolase [Candidatus Sphingomonas colombiensis]|nr:cell wall hydrolase [Sphingomonas sp.]WEK42094.1 MAG: cell wall hydrolase [Sphingomonas sp.]
MILCSLAALAFIAWLAIRDLRTVPHQKPAPRTLTMAQARAANAAIPFVPGKLMPARPFHFNGGPAAREQAIQCLATAALYEAGNDKPGQKAVMQVVLNRVRRAGYPKTVCGVVYQGAARTTGCQFSFTCDGSRTRRPERAGWTAARHAARRALSGYVFRAVGMSTHYHADWIVPYWIGSLDKIARVESHIFYRPRR